MNKIQPLDNINSNALKNRHGSSGVVTGRKIKNDCLIIHNKKRTYPSIILNNAKVKIKVGSIHDIFVGEKKNFIIKDKERSLSQAKISLEKNKKIGFSQNLSPVLRNFRYKFEDAENGEKKVLRHKGGTVKTARLLKSTEWSCCKPEVTENKAMVDLVKNNKESLRYKKNTGKLKILSKKKKKIMSKSEEKNKCKKKLVKKKTKNLKKFENCEKGKVDFKKLEKSVFSKLKKHKKLLKPKKTEEIISSLDTTRKKVKRTSEGFESEFLIDADFMKSMKTIKYIDADSLDSSKNVSKTQLSPESVSNAKHSLISPSSESQITVIHNPEFSPKAPKKVEKVPMSTFVAMIKSQNQSYSMSSEISYEVTEKLEDSIEPLKSESSFSEDSINSSEKIIEKNDLSEDVRKISLESEEKNLFVEKSESSSGSDPEESLKSIFKQNINSELYKIIERPGALLLKTPEISDSESDLVSSLISSNSSKPVSPKFLNFDSEILNILKTEIDFFLSTIKFETRTKIIDPSPEYISQYLTNLQEHPENNGKMVLDNINSAFGENPLDKLERIQLTDKGSIILGFNYEQLLNNTLHDQADHELKQIYDKFLFDTFNEALNYSRPFGFRGMPDPWEDRSDYCCNISSIQTLFKAAEKRLGKWENIKIGLIPSDFSYDDQEKLEKLREDRLNLILSQNIEEEEPDWTVYNWEETQSIIEISNLAFDHLLRESALILSLICYN